MGSLLPKLVELLQGEYNLQKDVRKQVTSLSKELESMHAALRKVAGVPHGELDEQVRLWARDIRDASYDMEDVVDSFLVRVEGCEATANPRRIERLTEKMNNLFSIKKFMDHHKIAEVIENIKGQLQDVAERRGRYTVDDVVAKPATASSCIDPRVQNLFHATKLLGIDEPRDALIKMLSVPQTDDVSDEKMKIVSIFGFGGLGKTTLAKAVYDKLKAKFDCWAFIPIGQNPDLKKVFRDILIDLDKVKYTNINMMILDERQLIQEIQEFLQNKRYLIVIDDIWDKSIWGIIKCSLVDNNIGSRIITTTRIYEVATAIGDVYTLKELSHDNAKELFYTRIFGQGKCPDNDKSAEEYSEILEVSGKILKKCRGVPLAIVTAASLLAHKPIMDWCSVYNSIGFGHDDSTQVQNTMKILSFSYYDLPSHLRTCLLYLTVYPEDYYIQKNDLIWRWIAEGFIHDEKEIGLFELGDSYLKELINRSMILPTGLHWACCVHDMVLRLLRSVSSEENFVTIVDSEKHTFPHSNVRRISLQNIVVDEEPSSSRIEMEDMARVRSFTAYDCSIKMVPPLCSFHVLRVLAVGHTRFAEGYDLKHIGSLVHMRHLQLLDLATHELPEEIGHLKFLQTLDIRLTGIEELPKAVGRLRQLMCLRADEKTRMPNWIGKLTSLQELSIWPTADQHASFVRELGKLTELRVLETRIDTSDEILRRALLESLRKLSKIIFIYVESSTSSDRVEDGAITCEAGLVLSRHLRFLDIPGVVFSRLPTWISSLHLPNLCHLDMSVLEVEQKDLEILGRFAQLRYLRLSEVKEISICMASVGGGGAFQNLTNCYLDIPVNFLPGSMPRLEALSFGFYVRQLKDANLDFDFGLGNLPWIQQVEVMIGCSSARAAEVEEAEAALRHAVDIHPNHATLSITRLWEDKMLGADDISVVPEETEEAASQ